MKAPITTHILNLQTGKPAGGVNVTLKNVEFPNEIFTAITDSDGRVLNWQAPIDLVAGIWELSFSVSEWFESQNQATFFSDVQLKFKVENAEEHYHVPLLLSAYGFSTYRGS